VKTILGLVNTLPEVADDFFEDTDTRMNLIEKSIKNIEKEAVKSRELYPDNEPLSVDENQISSIFRDLHTIKGNAATYGFEHLSRIAHQAEDALETLRPPVQIRVTDTVELLFSKLADMREERQAIDGISKKLRGGDQLMIHIAESKVHYLTSIAKKLVGQPEVAANNTLLPLLDACLGLRHQPLLKLVDKYKSMVERVAEKLGKEIEFDASPKEAELAPNFFSSVNESLIHILRNAADHGIESPEVREQMGKKPVGSVRMSVVQNDNSYQICISDDGAGIDDQKLVKKALALGLITDSQVSQMSHKDRVELLLLPGISTKATATDISGRGVGMDSVVKSLEKIGGSLQIQSELQFGTTFILEAPMSAFAEDDE
jgi:chemotaxis protein histidine kinase CheA